MFVFWQSVIEFSKFALMYVAVLLILALIWQWFSPKTGANGWEGFRCPRGRFLLWKEETRILHIFNEVRDLFDLDIRCWVDDNSVQLQELDEKLYTAKYWQVRKINSLAGGWASTLSPSDSTLCLGLERWIIFRNNQLRCLTRSAALHEIVHVVQEVQDRALTNEWRQNFPTGPDSTSKRRKTIVEYELEAYRRAPLSGFVLFLSLMGPPIITVAWSLSRWR